MTHPGAASISVLVVDDEPDLADLIGTYLERENDRFETATATSADEALDRLDASSFDCVVSDHDMPGRDGLELLSAVRERQPDLPVILYTGKGSEEIASDAITAGVTDYLEKESGTDQYTVLANRIERAVTEQRAKDALEESERRLSTLISNLPGMVYRCRNERGWPMEFVSEGAEELTGYTADEIESDEVSWGGDILLDEERDDLWESVQEALDAGEPFEVTYRIETKDGDRRWLWERGRGVYEGEDLVALEGFITDITARREHERELEQYRMLVENVADPMYIADDEGVLHVVNQTMADHLGYERSELLGRHVSTLMRDVDFERGERLLGEIVADDGSGIPEDERTAVFEYGYTTDADGTGFGLTIVENIVSGHDWSIHVTESEAGGARFDVVVDD